MKFKKSLLIMSVIILMMLITLIPSIAFAANELYLGITELNDNNWGYSIGNPNANGTTGNAHKIWNILDTPFHVNPVVSSNGILYFKNIYLGINNFYLTVKCF